MVYGLFIGGPLVVRAREEIQSIGILGDIFGWFVIKKPVTIRQALRQRFRIDLRRLRPGVGTIGPQRGRSISHCLTLDRIGHRPGHDAVLIVIDLPTEGYHAWPDTTVLCRNRPGMNVTTSENFARLSSEKSWPISSGLSKIGTPP